MSGFIKIGQNPAARKILSSSRDAIIAVLLCGSVVPVTLPTHTYFHTHRLVLLPALIGEASFCSG